MSEIKAQVEAWQGELQEILGEHPDIYKKISQLVAQDKYIEAFNYMDESLRNVHIELTERFKELNEDLFFSLRF